MKKITSFAMDEEVLVRFNKMATEKHWNKSSLVQSLIEAHLKAQK